MQESVSKPAAGYQNLNAIQTFFKNQHSRKKKSELMISST